eukprot:s1610_g7.t1
MMKQRPGGYADLVIPVIDYGRGFEAEPAQSNRIAGAVAALRATNLCWLPSGTDSAAWRVKTLEVVDECCALCHSDAFIYSCSANLTCSKNSADSR